MDNLHTEATHYIKENGEVSLYKIVGSIVWFLDGGEWCQSSLSRNDAVGFLIKL